MSIDFNMLLSRKAFLEELIRNKRRSLDNMPDGRLRISICRGSTSFYCVKDAKDTSGKYLNSQNKELITALAQKDYDQRLLKAAGGELKILNRLLKLEGVLVEDVFDSLSPVRRTLVTPVELPDDEYIRRWLEGKRCEPMGFDENDPVILTQEGYRVRSKSEQLWADTFYRMGVPYYFEPMLYLKGRGWVRPDFVGLNVRTRREKYVEHLGMMDDIGYSNKNVSKVHDYERNGFVLGEDLLITMETRRHPPEARTIENLIRKHFL